MVKTNVKINDVVLVADVNIVYTVHEIVTIYDVPYAAISEWGDSLYLVACADMGIKHATCPDENGDDSYWVCYEEDVIRRV